jgi:hypothetical protein
VNEIYSALILDDVDRPEMLEDDDELIEAEDLDGYDTSGERGDGIPVTADEEHLLARLMGKGARENGAAAEGDELLDDELYPSSPDDEED